MIGARSGSASVSGFSFPCVRFIGKQKGCLGAESSGEAVGPASLRSGHRSAELNGAF